MSLEPAVFIFRYRFFNSRKCVCICMCAYSCGVNNSIVRASCRGSRIKRTVVAAVVVVVTRYY